MKRFLKILIGLLVGLGLVFFLIRTPDTDPIKMQEKYGGGLAQYSGSELKVHYRDQGNREGEPVFFIHGSNASLHTWEDVIASMPQDYRLISLDLPGHGLTGAHPQSLYSAEGFFDAIDAVRNELGITEEKLTLVGNSMGGWVSWRYALKYPDRVRSMVLIDAAGAPTEQKPPLNLGFRLMRNPVTRSLAEQVTPRWLVKKSLIQTVNDPALITEEVVDRYWEMLRYPGNRRATVQRSIQPRETAEYGTQLGEITTPTLILWGETDQLIFLSSAQTFDHELPNSRLITYPDIGHLPMEENPNDVVRDITTFLVSLSADEREQNAP